MGKIYFLYSVFDRTDEGEQEGQGPGHALKFADELGLGALGYWLRLVLLHLLGVRPTLVLKVGVGKHFNVRT